METLYSLRPETGSGESSKEKQGPSASVSRRARPSTSPPRYADRVDELTESQPHLRLLHEFLTFQTPGNAAASFDAPISKKWTVLDRKKKGGWTERRTTGLSSSLSPSSLSSSTTSSPHLQRWQPDELESDCCAIILDYLDPDAVETLGSAFDIEPDFFHDHLALYEQHYTGSWRRPSQLSSPNATASARRRAHFFSIGYRRAYGKNTSQESYDQKRINTCSILRSFHNTLTLRYPISHERFSVAFIHPSPGRPSSIPTVIYICDPIIDQPQLKIRSWRTVQSSGLRHAGPSAPVTIDPRLPLATQTATWLLTLPSSEPVDLSQPTPFIVGPLLAIFSLWGSVCAVMGEQISSLEDQLEFSIWEGQRDPTVILQDSQKLSRRLSIYRSALLRTHDGVISKLDPRPHPRDIHRAGAETEQSESVLALIEHDMEQINAQLTNLVERAKAIVPTLLALMSVNESKQASNLTKIAFIFAPLSLATAIVSIDGSTRLAGRKFWILICFAVPILLVTMAFAGVLQDASGQQALYWVKGRWQWLRLKLRR